MIKRTKRQTSAYNNKENKRLSNTNSTKTGVILGFPEQQFPLFVVGLKTYLIQYIISISSMLKSKIYYSVWQFFFLMATNMDDIHIIYL